MVKEMNDKTVGVEIYINSVWNWKGNASETRVQWNSSFSWRAKLYIEDRQGAQDQLAKTEFEKLFLASSVFLD